MKVIDGIELLRMIKNKEIKCKTLIRHKKEDAILLSNPPQLIYEYYIFSEGDGRFHRCDENGKLGAVGQEHFMNYSTLYKKFEIIEENKIKKLDKSITDNVASSVDMRIISNKINEIIDKINKIGE